MRIDENVYAVFIVDFEEVRNGCELFFVCITDYDKNK